MVDAFLLYDSWNTPADLLQRAPRLRERGEAGQPQVGEALILLQRPQRLHPQAVRVIHTEAVDSLVDAKELVVPPEAVDSHWSLG